MRSSCISCAARAFTCLGISVLLFCLILLSYFITNEECSISTSLWCEMDQAACEVDRSSTILDQRAEHFSSWPFLSLVGVYSLLACATWRRVEAMTCRPNQHFMPSRP